MATASELQSEPHSNTNSNQTRARYSANSRSLAFTDTGTQPPSILSKTLSLSCEAMPAYRPIRSMKCPPHIRTCCPITKRGGSSIIPPSLSAARKDSTNSRGSFAGASPLNNSRNMPIVLMIACHGPATRSCMNTYPRKRGTLALRGDDTFGR